MGHEYVKENETFNTSRNGVVPKPTASDVSNNKVLGASGLWITQSGGGGSSSLSGLDDVNLTSPTNGQLLQFDSTSQKWVNANKPMHNYSTSEQVVGTWIDGKPLYEKSYIYENSSGSAGGSSGATFDVWNLGSDKVIISDGLQCTFVNLVTNKMYPLPYADSSFTNIFVDNGIVKLRVRSDDWGSNYKLYMTARYIKTTD